jgi:cytochrome c-type biogenesis protein CcmH
MTVFWIGVAGLVLLAWLMVLPASRLRPAAAAERAAHLDILKDQLAALDAELAAGSIDAPQHATARQEVQRRVLDETQAEARPLQAGGSRKTLLFVGLAVPLFAAVVYAAIGNPAGLAPQAALEARAAQEITPEAVEAMVAKLAQRLETSTGDPASDLKGWTMLARSYAALQRFADADKAYARAIALAPADAQLLADRADALAMVQDRSMQGEPDRLIAKALVIDPNNLKALALAGASAFERKDFTAARGYWQKARSLVPPESEFAARLDSSLNEMRGLTADAAPASASGSASAPVTTDAARISGRVSLSPALAGRVTPTDTVFIFARAVDGPRMPLAILKRTVADLPITFTLDDSMAMSPEMKLSKFPRVVVGARVSRSGNAMPQPGDLRGESTPTGVRATDVQLVIDGVQP